MAKPDTLIVDGHARSWQRLCELRRQQLEAWKAAQPSQPADPNGSGRRISVVGVRQIRYRYAAPPEYCSQIASPGSLDF
jgi:hypothetical protein